MNPDEQETTCKLIQDTVRKRRAMYEIKAIGDLPTSKASKLSASASSSSKGSAGIDLTGSEVTTLVKDSLLMKGNAASSSPSVEQGVSGKKAVTESQQRVFDMFMPPKKASAGMF